MRAFLTALVAALLLAAVGATSASAAQLVTNGDFETGTLSGWSAASQTTAGKWFAYSRQQWEDEGVGIFAPPSGKYAAGGESGSIDSVTLSQEVNLPARSTDQLSMLLGYDSSEPMTGSPATSLEATEAGGSQVVRVDVLRAGSALDTLQPADILKTIFATEPGSPEELEPTQLTADLSAFAGQTVNLRIASLVEEGPMGLVIDNVSIESTALATAQPTPQPSPSPSPSPSNLFTKGRLTLNRKNGTGFLPVNIPGPGVLTATDAKRMIAVGSLARSKGKKKPILIKTATVTGTVGGTVRVPIRATPAGLKILKEKGKLAFQLKLTFAPTGGTPATQGYSGKLARTIKPAPR